MISSKNKNAIDPKQKWRYVLRHGSGGSSKHILEIGKDSKKILVQYLPSSYVISKNITDPAKHFLGCNNIVRDYTNIGEKGKMVMAGILRPNKTKTDMLFQDLVLLPDN